MRIGDGALYARYLDALSRARERSDVALRSFGDGKRVRVSSDDTGGAGLAVSTRARLARLAGYERSAQSACADLATLDDSLGSLGELLGEAQVLASAGASTPGENGNSIRAVEVDRLREQVLFLANRDQGGRHLFGGTETTSAPFATDGTYSGNDDEVQAPIDDQQTVGATLSGRNVFQGAGGDLFALLDDLAQALRDNRTDDVGNLVPALSDALDHVSQIRGEVGSRLERIDTGLLNQGDETASLAIRLGQLEDADLVRVATELQSSQTSAQALSAAAAQVLGRSLFDFLG